MGFAKGLSALAVVLLAASAVLASQWPTVSSRPADGRDPSGELVFTFRQNSVIYANGNGSIMILDGAYIGGPLGMGDPSKASLKSLIGKNMYGVTVWMAGVSWLTKPLEADLHIKGWIKASVWLGSPDWLWFFEFSGYGFGISEVDHLNRPVGEPVYAYHYGVGNVLTAEPREYSISIEVDRTFKKGDRIAFVIGFGSTRRGWSVNVYFDSPLAHSRAIVEGLEASPSSNPASSVASPVLGSLLRIEVKDSPMGRNGYS